MIRYAEIYLLAGVAILVMGAIVIPSTEMASGALRPRDLISRIRSSSWEDWLFATIVVVVVVTLWSGLLAWGLFEILRPKSSVLDGLIQKKEPEFRVRPHHLRGTQTIEEIEAAERVTDPLGAVPDLPFGHLNEAWQRFVASIPPGATVARFSARWRAHRYLVEDLEGYVVVQAGRPGNHWVSAKVRVEVDEAEDRRPLLKVA